MLAKIQKAIFDYLSNFFSQYGIPNEFVYDPDMNLILEYQKAQRLRMKDRRLDQVLAESYSETNIKELYEKLQLKFDNQRFGIGLGVFSRTPLVKSDQYNNANTMEMKSPSSNPDSPVEIRNVVFASTEYSVSMIFDNHDLADLAEITYCSLLSRLQKTVTVDFILDDNNEITGVPYNINFQDISDVSKPNTSNLRTLSFGFTMSGIFFLPFYKEEYRIKEVRLDIHAFDIDTNINPKVFWKPTNHFRRDNPQHVRMYKTAYMGARDRHPAKVRSTEGD